MDKLPFTVYDFFGYLASGFVLLAAVTAAFVGSEPLRNDPNVVVALLLVVAAYVAGHVVANLAGDLIERRVVRNRLGTPMSVLLGKQHLSPRAQRFFPGYAEALPDEIQKRVGEQAERDGITDRGEALFYHCHARLKADSAVSARLNIFLNLYGFCRNMTMALVLAAATLTVGIVAGTAEAGSHVEPAWWIAAALIAAVGLFYRYLKFLRQYAVELLTSYAATDLTAPQQH